ncbi:LOW QUALITY PROTEIN: pleckstrin homology domain-containing family S member 1 [Anomaloglossus baeobatrachus]|uniref:LOW QUALITY PROTEIN: pleckstrin homology domain-containing family S member 1 n=1 Tax=Anomaloglossus baeobatrachus TaxID=238106 RepID=UPI003F502AE9
MGPKRRSSITDEEIIKQGCLIKSPPSYVFTKKASWKARLLKLCRTSQGSFILRYYGYNGVTQAEDWKGDILISNIKSIEVGKNLTEKIPAITRLFNSSPDNILCIRTDRRDYYLLDESTENIAEWQKYITDAWETVHQKVTIGQPTNPSANLLEFIQDQRKDTMRPNSYPTDRLHGGVETDAESKRQRSQTDPNTVQRNMKTLSECAGPSITREEVTALKCQQSKTLPNFCQIPTDSTDQPEEERRHSDSADSAPAQPNPDENRSSDDMTDRAYDSESEREAECYENPVYDVPRPLNKSRSQDSAVEQEETSESDDDSSSGDDVYEDMLSIAKVINSPQKPPRNFNITPITRYTDAQKSRLKKAQILKMMYESHSDGDLETLRVSLPTEHLQKYLGLEEIGEKLRVAKWKGPAHIGCLFHHGDIIESINEFWAGSEDFFFQMLSFSISREVNLVMTRDKKAPVFHQEGCTCDRS